MVWSIVSDSSCDLSADEFAGSAVRFESVPLRLRVGETEFVDTENLCVRDLLDAMAAESGPSSSACPSPGAFARAFEKGDKTVCFTISGSLSGSYNSALQGRALVLEEHPEKEICVIDSCATAGAMILLIRRARELMESAAPEAFAGICAALQRYRSGLRTCFTLENFDNLIKNGRMRPLVGSLLHSIGIHVVAEGTPQGAINVTAKAKGEKHTLRAITSLMARSKDCAGVPVIISHCENPGGAKRLRDQILSDLPVKSVEIRPCRGLNSFYAMEKGLIIGY